MDLYYILCICTRASVTAITYKKEKRKKLTTCKKGSSRTAGRVLELALLAAEIESRSIDAISAPLRRW
jgi:hypothetical protein